MAGSPASENSDSFDGAESSQPATPDWEVLSMSTMSASTLGLPQEKSHDTETVAEYKDQGLAEEASGEQENHLMDSHVFKKDTEHKDMQPPVGPSHEALLGTEACAIQEESIPGKVYQHDGGLQKRRKVMEATMRGFWKHETPISSKKKKIRVLWSKRQVFNWQPESRKYSAVLSIALMAAVVGIAVIGHRLRRERNLNHQLRLEVSSKEEKLNDLMYQVNRMKEAMTGRRRVGITRNSFF